MALRLNAACLAAVAKKKQTVAAACSFVTDIREDGTEKCQNVVQNSPEWRDSGRNKENATGACPRTREGRWVGDRFKHAGVQANVVNMQEALVGLGSRRHQAPAHVGNGVVSFGYHISVEPPWQKKYFRESSSWWDNRDDKSKPTNVKSNNKDAHWTDNRYTPQKVTEVLQRKTSRGKAGRGSFGSGNQSHGECRKNKFPRNAVHMVSPNREALAWTARMSQHVKCGQARQALNTYKEMRKAGVQPSSYTFVAALKACSTVRDLESAKHIHAEAVKSGSESHVIVGTMLVDTYCKCGSLVDARRVFEAMLHRDVVSWNAIISGYAQMEDGEQALQLYARMEQEGFVPNDRTFVSVLKACSSVAALEANEMKGTAVKKHSLEQVRAIHLRASKTGCAADVFVGTMLVDAYCKCGSLVDARHVFEEMPHRDVVSWNAMIAGYAHMEEGAEALQSYTTMQQGGVLPDDRTFVGVLKACGSLMASEEANEMEGIMVKMISLGRVRTIHAHIVTCGLESNVFVGNMLVDVYAKCGGLVHARDVFETISCRDVVSWTAMILGCALLENSEAALQLYAQMQQEGIEPNDLTFVAALKACSSFAAFKEGNQAAGRRCLEQVRAIHAQVLKSESDSGVFVETMLVDVYAKCGSLVDARCVFENMPQRDVVSWNAMIMGYARMEEGEEALQLFAQMQQEGVKPDARTMIGALKACGSLAALKERNVGDWLVVKEQRLKQIKDIHFCAVRGACESDLFVGNMLVNTYAKCGSLLDARGVFEGMPHRDVVSWNAMILGCAELEEGDEALQLYVQMQQEGLAPNDQTFLGVLKACSSLATSRYSDEILVKERCLEQVKAIHSLVVKMGSDSTFVATMLVDAYSKCGSLVDARGVFAKLPLPDVVAWNAMIFGCAQMNKSEEALSLYAAMQQEGVSPDDHTFVGVLKACSSLPGLEEGNQIVKTQCLEQVKAVHSEVVMRHGIHLPIFVGTTLLDVYAKCGRLLDARSIFDKMLHRDVVSWNSMIYGYSQTEEGQEALNLYSRMRQEGASPDDRTFVGALKACSSLAGFEEAVEADGISVKSQCLGQVRALHSDIVSSPYVTDVFVGTMLVDAFVKCGSLVDARFVFEKMPHHYVVSWNAMILGYAQMKQGDKALELYARMQQEGVVPDDRTFVAALKACGSVAGLAKGKQIHSQVSKSGLDSTDSYVASSLIDMYCKCGSMIDAEQVFGALASRDVVTWNALIAGYARQGKSELVFDLFERMCREGIPPNDITFVSVLNVCNHVGLVSKGRNFFEAMCRDYDIAPSIEHYSCMVDLLGRAGEMDKAMEVVKNMPFKPNGGMWRSVLGACQKWRNVDVGRHAFDCAVKLDKKDAAAYALMSNIYLAAQMGGDAKEIQAMRTKAKAQKQPGQSWWTDISGDVHDFLVGDHRQEGQGLHAKLEELVTRMKKE